MKRRGTGSIVIAAAGMIFLWGSTPVESQSGQVVEVTIKDFRFVAKQTPLRLGVPTTIKITNADGERHDFSSTMFEGIPTRIEQGGVMAYGRGVGGVMLDSKRDAVIRFKTERPGSHTFRCSIHPDMKGELLLLIVESV